MSAETQPIDLESPALYINRELSLLAFQERVLEEAEDPANPLLERVKFLSIFSSNMAEFYMVRIAGLKQQVRAGVRELSVDGQTPSEQLHACRERARALLARGREGYVVVRGELGAHGIHLLDYGQLDDAQRTAADAYFENTVFPVLTPLAFDPARPFPHISNLSLNLAVMLAGPDGERRFARVKVPKVLPRLVPVCPPAQPPACGSEGENHSFVWLEQLVAAHLPALFPDVAISAVHEFRVTRDAEYVIQELEADDLLETIEEGVRRRRFGSVVRVTIAPDTPEFLRDVLSTNLELEPEDLVALEPPLGLSDLMQLYGLDRPDLKDPPFVPVTRADLDPREGEDLFAVVKRRDVLLHRPFESFEPIVRLLQNAATDPGVLAIKIALYRVGRDAPVVQALLDAAENGKEVTALVELKARFDEESNIVWARKLEQAGVHVVYGVLGLKTHAKVALIVRQEDDEIVRYVHVGTGNYNTTTAVQYTDLDLLTVDRGMGEDASELFNYLTGYARVHDYERFVVAPGSARTSLRAMIEGEIANAEAGVDARIILKLNALVDLEMARLLYRASQAGVQIDLVCRGMCVLRPGVPGVSDNITVRSILGRYLEHSRIYWFANGGDPKVLVGSADVMRRNLDRRVEVLVPVLDAELVRHLRDEVLQTYLEDNVKAREMRADGTYGRVTRADGEPAREAQVVLAKLYADRDRGR